MSGNLDQSNPRAPHYPNTPRPVRGPTRPLVTYALCLVLAGAAFSGGFFFGYEFVVNGGTNGSTPSTAASIPATANTTFTGAGGAAMTVTTGCGTQSVIDVWTCTETVTNTGDTMRTITSISIPCGGTETLLPLQIAGGASVQLDLSADVTVDDQLSGSLHVQISVQVT